MRNTNWNIYQLPITVILYSTTGLQRHVRKIFNFSDASLRDSITDWNKFCCSCISSTRSHNSTTTTTIKFVTATATATTIVTIPKQCPPMTLSMMLELLRCFVAFSLILFCAFTLCFCAQLIVLRCRLRLIVERLIVAAANDTPAVIIDMPMSLLISSLSRTMLYGGYLQFWH
jgi:hypothetical protein